MDQGTIGSVLGMIQLSVWIQACITGNPLFYHFFHTHDDINMISGGGLMLFIILFIQWM